MIDLQESTNGMLELMYGDQEASLLHALRVAALSPLQPLDANGRMSRLLAPFAGKPLPEKETLFQLLKLAKGVVFSNHLNALYAIDVAWQAGLLDRFTYVPCDYEGQVQWREELVSIIKGMSYKTVSFALLIFAPLQCELVAIDRWHLRRLGLNPNRTPVGKKYLALELAIMSERDQAGYRHIALGTYAAHLWGIQRDGIDASYPSHKALSCRWY